MMGSVGEVADHLCGLCILFTIYGVCARRKHNSWYLLREYFAIYVMSMASVTSIMTNNVILTTPWASIPMSTASVMSIVNNNEY